MSIKRIFWMGSHKVLLPTELKALQDMGYETFYPPYLGKERDQSAVYDWTCPETTLPADVVAELSQYNFFWNSINERIASLLNTYFDCVMVTINGDWLLSFLKVFEKKIIYRTFGEPYSLSRHLVSNGAREYIENHTDFWFMPHSPETAAKEEYWLRRRERIVPYSLTSDVLSLAGTWNPDYSNGKASIGLTCPNIVNPYYNEHFRYLKENFEERFYRYYGVQVDKSNDPNVVGTLERMEQLKQFQALSGFLYTYREANVCYLPPVEMMVLGGPVLYLPGSLLDRYLGENDVGRVMTEDEARRASKRLISGDRDFADEIVESQRGVALRYDSSYTLPIFRKAMSEIFPILEEVTEDSASLCSRRDRHNGDRPVLLLGHFPGVYSLSDGEYISVHGIPRVMRRIVQVLTEAGQRVTVTACPEAMNETWGFYASQTSRKDLLDVIDSDKIFNASDEPTEVPSVDTYFEQVRENTIHWVDGNFSFPVIVTGGLVRLFSEKKQIPEPETQSLDEFSYVIVPHYYLFPEIARFDSPNILAYIPDYMPHFFKNRGWFQDDKKHREIGENLVHSAKYVMTNSLFTKGYLPESDLKVEEGKIAAFPLPHLASDRQKAVDMNLVERLSKSSYIFYPTQAHPNKRLDLLAKAWLRLREVTGVDYTLVLTCGIMPPEVERIVGPEGIGDEVLLLPGISDSMLTWLYKNALCLAFTSEMEGNFPTQILEALELECPVVTFNHPTVNAELGDDAALLATAPFADIEAFTQQLICAQEDRASVLRKQNILLDRIGDKFGYERYKENILSLHEKMRAEA